MRAAEQLLAAERENHKIAVEVKSFISLVIYNRPLAKVFFMLGFASIVVLYSLFPVQSSPIRARSLMSNRR